ncbi:MAG TPA: YdeI/OmpD-associated family protein [Bauldia sp.]|nr:YdeI/OmpD-associated family protein [Bauldia sp.]
MTAPLFFRTAKEWRVWLQRNHASATELVVGFHKATSSQTGITYREALDEALCFGWIDAVRRGGEHTWSIRFTPRKAFSIWSQINIRRMEELKREGRLHAAGLAVYEGRDPRREKKYSYENRDNAKLSAAEERAFRADRKAWANFEKMPPSYRRPAIWWVVGAKRNDTRQRRLAALIADSAAGRKVKHLRRPGDKAEDP